MKKVKLPARYKRMGFYAQLPKHTVQSIRRLAKSSKTPQWAVVSAAIATHEDAIN